MDGGERDDDDGGELRELLARMTELRAAVVCETDALLAEWGAAGPDGPDHAALNLAHYLALRRHDLSALQHRLAAFGLSSLGRSEARVLAALDALITTLRRLCGDAAAAYPPRSMMKAGDDALRDACARIFGDPRKGPDTRVMATMPPETASDAALVGRLMEAGMDCARINCAHDDADAWSRMIDNIRAAEKTLGRSCRILMDIAGPKCRIAAVRAPEKFRLHRGDRLTIERRLDPRTTRRIAISLSFPQIVDQLVVGAEVFIDDGKVGARVVETSADRVEIEVFSAAPKGARLKPGKGLNFPTTELDLSPLTVKDVADLGFIAQHADLVAYSFVQKPSDVELLQDHLAARRGVRPPQPLVLKIETPLAVRNLPQLILQSSRLHPTAVMIARGDLAVELGFARLSEIQEELLWLCEAAHVPVVWATQVLDRFVKDGVSSRAETTDAAMAQRADCVMLNKGAHLAEGIALLRDILSRMDRHHAKKFARFPQLRAWT